jgi:S1-C subfamily serine protease
VGVKVNQVIAGSPAADCSITQRVDGEYKLQGNMSLAPGDLILYANGKAVRSAADLNRIISTVPRNGFLFLKGLDATKGLKLAYAASTKLDRDGQSLPIPSPQFPDNLDLQKAKSLLGRRIGVSVKENDGVGVVIGEIFAGTPALNFVLQTANGNQRVALAPNDFIAFVNDEPVHTERDLLKIVSRLEPGSTLRIAGLDQSTSWQTPFQGYLIVGQ